MEVKLTLSDKDVQSIADQVAERIAAREPSKDEGKTSPKATTKGKGKSTPKESAPSTAPAEEGTEESNDEKTITLADVKAKLREVKEAKGTAASMNTLHEYASKLSAVKEEDYAALIASLDAKLAEEGKDEEEAEDPFA